MPTDWSGRYLISAEAVGYKGKNPTLLNINYGVTMQLIHGEC